MKSTFCLVLHIFILHDTFLAHGLKLLLSFLSMMTLMLGLRIRILLGSKMTLAFRIVRALGMFCDYFSIF